MEEAGHAAREAAVFLVVGTSAVVYPAAGLIPLARQAGAKVIEVNTERTPYSGCGGRLPSGPAGEILPALVAAVPRVLPSNR